MAKDNKYSNINARVAEARKDKENAGRIPEGDFNTVFDKGELKKSRAQNDMFEVKLRIKWRDNTRLHGKFIWLRYVLHLEWQVDRFLMLMADLGVDMSQIKNDEDFVKVFLDLEDDRPQIAVRVSRDKKNPQYDNILVLSTGEVIEPSLVEALPPLTDEEKEAAAAAEADDAGKLEGEKPEEKKSEAAPESESDDDTPY